MAGRRVGQACTVLLAALAFSLPFELEKALVSIGPIQFTNLELILDLFLGVVALAVAVGALSLKPLKEQLPRSWLWLLAAFVIGLAVSAWLAPALNLNAWKASGRTLTGAALAASVTLVVRRRTQAAVIMLSILAAGALSVVAGLVEFASQAPAAWLNPFRQQPSMVGPFLRLSGTIDYANQMAMFLEATLPLLAGLLVYAASKARPARVALGGLLLVAFLQAGLLTYSRGFIVSLLISFLLLAALTFRLAPARAHPSLGKVWVGVPLLTLVLLAATSILDPAARLRYATQAESDWYRITLLAPASLRLPAGQTMTVPIQLHNQGVFTWSSEGETAFRLAAAWFHDESRAALVQEQRWPLPEGLAPGDEVSFSIRLQAPAIAGDYLVDWDMIHEGVTTASAKTGRRTTSMVSVTSGAEPSGVGVEWATSQAIQSAPVIPNRLTLWVLAWRLFADSPWTGIGLDNFRLTYGRLLGWQAWNTSIHSNSLPIEMLVSLGVAGALPFFLWLGALLADIGLMAIRSKMDWLRMAVGSALLAYMVHGFVDYFLLFNATGLLFWLLVGLWIAFRDRRTTIGQ